MGKYVSQAVKRLRANGHKVGKVDKEYLEDLEREFADEVPGDEMADYLYSIIEFERSSN